MANETMKTKVETDTYKSSAKRENRDPITGEPGSHPLATTVGAAVGTAAGVAGAAAWGAATGAVLGPVGAIAGAAAGGILGGGIGHGIGEDIFPTELAYWQETYMTRPYVSKETNFDTYQPAYRYGIEAGIKHKGRDFNEIEPQLGQGWNSARANSNLDWNNARHATRDAYERLNTLDDDGM